jgi:hypothetical protein
LPLRSFLCDVPVFNLPVCPFLRLSRRSSIPEMETGHPQISQICADSRRRMPSANLVNLENLWIERLSSPEVDTWAATPATGLQTVNRAAE